MDMEKENENMEGANGGYSMEKLTNYQQAFNERDYRLMENRVRASYMKEERIKLEQERKHIQREILRAEKENTELIKQLNALNELDITRENSLRGQTKTIILYQDEADQLKRQAEEEKLRYADTLANYRRVYNEKLKLRESDQPLYKELKELKETHSSLSNKLDHLECELKELTEKRKKQVETQRNNYHTSFVNFAQSCKDFNECQRGNQMLQLKLEKKNQLLKELYSSRASTNFLYKSTITTTSTISYNSISLNRPESAAVLHAKKMLAEAKAKYKERFNKSFNSSHLFETESEHYKIKTSMKRTGFPPYPSPAKYPALESQPTPNGSQINIMSVEILQSDKQVVENIQSYTQPEVNLPTLMETDQFDHDEEIIKSIQVPTTTNSLIAEISTVKQSIFTQPLPTTNNTDKTPHCFQLQTLPEPLTDSHCIEDVTQPEDNDNAIDESFNNPEYLNNPAFSPLVENYDATDNFQDNAGNSNFGFTFMTSQQDNHGINKFFPMF